MPPHRPRRFRSRFQHGQRSASADSRQSDAASAESLAPEHLAADDLRFIRQTMERSSVFTAVPGWGMVIIGCTAFPAAWLAARHAFDLAWLQVWITDAVLATSVSIVAIHMKASRAGLPWTTGPGRKVALTLAPPIVAAALLTIPLMRAGQGHALPGAWLLLYGCGVIAGGAFSVSIVPVMGICFMVLGAATLFLPTLSPAHFPLAIGNWAMAAGFGAFHIIFGFWIARRYGG
jgi:hypothetical protein